MMPVRTHGPRGFGGAPLPSNGTHERSLMTELRVSQSEHLIVVVKSSLCPSLPPTGAVPETTGSLVRDGWSLEWLLTGCFCRTVGAAGFSYAVFSSSSFSTMALNFLKSASSRFQSRLAGATTVPSRRHRHRGGYRATCGRPRVSRGVRSSGCA
jgi:hypothetical protein